MTEEIIKMIIRFYKDSKLASECWLKDFNEHGRDFKGIEWRNYLAMDSEANAYYNILFAINKEINEVFIHSISDISKDIEKALELDDLY